MSDHVQKDFGWLLAELDAGHAAHSIHTSESARGNPSIVGPLESIDKGFDNEVLGADSISNSFFLSGQKFQAKM